MAELQAVLRGASRGVGASAALGDELAEAVAYAPADFENWDELRTVFAEPVASGFPDGYARCLIDAPAIVDVALTTDAPVKIEGVDAPHILKLYLRRAAQLLNTKIVVDCEDGKRVTAPDDAALGQELRPGIGRVYLDPQLYADLAALAARMHVPATEETRLSGAGAGLNDND